MDSEFRLRKVIRANSKFFDGFGATSWLMLTFCQEDYKYLKNNFEELLVDISTLSNDYEITKIKIENYKNEIENYKHEIEEQKVVHEKLIKENDMKYINNHNLVESLSSQVKLLNRTLEESDFNLEESKYNNRSFTKDFFSKDSQINTLNTTNEKLVNKVKKQTSQIETLRQELESKTREIESLRSK